MGPGTVRALCHPHHSSRRWVLLFSPLSERGRGGSERLRFLPNITAHLLRSPPSRASAPQSVARPTGGAHRWRPYGGLERQTQVPPGPLPQGLPVSGAQGFEGAKLGSVALDHWALLQAHAPPIRRLVCISQQLPARGASSPPGSPGLPASLQPVTTPRGLALTFDLNRRFTRALKVDVAMEIGQSWGDHSSLQTEQWGPQFGRDCRPHPGKQKCQAAHQGTSLGSSIPGFWPTWELPGLGAGGISHPWASVSPSAKPSCLPGSSSRMRGRLFLRGSGASSHALP